jgi:hypothetical protein
MNNVHRLYRVVFVPESSGWRVRAANGAFASGTHASREETIAFAKELAEGHGWARIIVHGLDGTVEREFVYGSDRREHAVKGRNVQVVRPSWPPDLPRPSWI